MADRFYKFTFKDGRPIYFEDFGAQINLSGLVWQGEGGKTIITMLPNAVPLPNGDVPELQYISAEDMDHILQCTDKPEIYQLDQTGAIKAWHRKSESIISGYVQQQVWVRDDFTCLFCGRRMGEIVLTVDHFVPLQLGGENTTENFLSACRRCQKLKGAIHPERYCADNNLDYKGLVLYLQGKAPRAYIAHLH